MIGPTVASRMEQGGNLSSNWIDAGQVRALAQIAAVTCEVQIAVIIVPLMLARNYVLDVMSKRATVLRKAAILAAVSRSGSDEQPRRRFPSLRGVRKLASSL